MIQGRQWQIRKRKRREWIKRILLVTAGMGIVLCMEQGKRLWDGISARDTEEAGEQKAVEASEGLREEAPQEAETTTGRTGRNVIDGFPCILQTPEYPSGCEIAAMTSLLNDYGYPVTKQTMVNRYLPIQEEMTGGKNFREAYLGSIDDEGAWGGCYAEVIAEAANHYLNDYNGGMRAKIISGASPQELYAYLEAGTPVVVWVTIDMQKTEIMEMGEDRNGDPLIWHKKSHTVVLTGYDRNIGMVYVADPLRGNTVYPMSSFETAYEAIGREAVILDNFS